MLQNKHKLEKFEYSSEVSQGRFVCKITENKTQMKIEGFFCLSESLPYLRFRVSCQINYSDLAFQGPLSILGKIFAALLHLHYLLHQAR